MAFSVIFIPKTPKFIKIQLKISAIPQNHAKFMQNFTSWRENVFLLRKSWFSGGGCFFTPPRYTSIKKSPGINRVKSLSSIWFLYSKCITRTPLKCIIWTPLTVKLVSDNLVTYESPYGTLQVCIKLRIKWIGVDACYNKKTFIYTVDYLCCN